MRYKKQLRYFLVLILINLLNINSTYSVETNTLNTNEGKSLAVFIQNSLKNNPVMQQAIIQVNIAKEKRQASSKWLYNPEIELGFEDKKGAQRSELIRISQTIDWSGKSSAAVRVADLELQSVIATKDQIYQELSVNILRTLTEYQSSNAVLELSKRRVELTRRFLDFVKNSFEVGDIDQSSYNLARLAYSEALIKNTEEQVALINAQQKLESLIGFSLVDIEELPILSTTLPSVVMSDNLSKSLIENLPTIRLLKIQKATSKAQVLLAKRQQNPDPTFSLTSGESEGDNVVGLSLSIPINIFNNYSNEVAIAKYTNTAQEKSLKNAYYLAKLQLKNSNKIYKTYNHVWLVWQGRGISVLNNQVDLLEKKFKAGDIQVTDYLVQLQQIIDSEIAIQTLHRKAWIAWYDWLLVSGSVQQYLEGKI